MFRQISPKSSYNKLSRNFHKIKSKENDSKLSKEKSSKIIRNEFINYFTNLNHKLIPSSRVLPLCDSSLSFVNAGMIQFKGIFLSHHPAPVPRATNSQKCIRVGGKHNDLTAVGLDSYHHTFFEMLGNWSFNNYKKLEACSYAWSLLTKTFGINKNRLYVTYFKGDELLNLPADYETREIWRQLGLPDERILPFGVKENFWEMGVSGPCGPCTEIHIDHNCSSSNQAFKVNQGHADLTELWNIVFIQHQRHQNGSITPLDHQHVDTGMGFERLVAILQGKNSNYDTDLFQPLFDVIQKQSCCPFYQGNFGDYDVKGLDTDYRILADHARMISVALADGVIPEENYKLRRVLRRAVTIASDTFRSDNLLQELSYHVAESLGDAYPEIKNNMPQIQKIIEYEKEVWKSLMKSSGKQWQELIKSRPILATISEQYHPGLVSGYKRLQSLIENDRINKISGDLALELFLSHSLDLETISELAKIEGLGLDEAEYYRLLEDHKMNSRLGIVGQAGGQLISDETLDKLKSRVASTDDSFKYNYSFADSRYQFPVLETKIAGILVDGELIQGGSLEVSKKKLEGHRVAIVLEKTSMFAREGGQQSDRGKILINNVTFIVKGVRKSRNFVVHLGNIDFSSLMDESQKISTGDVAKIYLDEEARLGLMRHHTATHLLNAALRKIYPVVVQRGSVIKENELTFIFSGFGDKIRGEDVEALEKIINDSIQHEIPVVVKKINGVELMGDMDLTLLPGEVYPDVDLRIIDIKGSVFQSKEACCGTHVHNTSALEHFIITDVTANGPTSRTIKAVAGGRARDLTSASIGLREKSKFQKFENTKTLDSFKKTMYAFVEEDIKEALKINKDPLFFVHCIKIRNNIGSQSIPLQYAIDCNPDLPQFLIGRDNRTIRARCFVPKKYVSSGFNARLWMEHVSPIIRAEIGSFDDEDPLEVSHTKRVKFHRDEIDDLANRAIEAARNFISCYLKNNQQQEDSKKS